MQQFGAVFGIAVATTVFNSRGSLASAAAITSGYRPALGVAAGLSVLGAAAALALRRPARPATPHPRPAAHPQPAARPGSRARPGPMTASRPDDRVPAR
jgi:hypothetical protein